MRWDQVLRRDSAVTGPLIAVGHDNVHELAALPDQSCDSPAGQELRIVGVRSTRPALAAALVMSSPVQY
jgi:hypothetical protein